MISDEDVRRLGTALRARGSRRSRLLWNGLGRQEGRAPFAQCLPDQLSRSDLGSIEATRNRD